MAGYTIAPGQRERLRTEGFVRLPAAVPPDLLARLQRMADRLEARALDDHGTGKGGGKAAVVDTPAGPVLERIGKLLEWSPGDALDLLASPAMMAVARELVGDGAVPVEMGLLYKRQHPLGHVIWHQDAQHSRRWPYLNVGIYLDDAPQDDGCLRYVPRTQHERQDICTLTETHGWHLPGAVDLPAVAGDILVQDVMILHASPPKRRTGVRRTVYVEFRPAGAIVADRSQSPEWARLRRRWMALVAARADPADWPEDWRARLPRTGDEASEIAAIAALHEPPLPAHYCHRPVAHPDYPVPADLREAP